MGKRSRERQKKKTSKFLAEFYGLDVKPYNIERARREEEKTKRELTEAQKEYCKELRTTIKFVTEEFAMRTKEEERDALHYKALAETMFKEGLPTVQRLFLELSAAESEHARRLQAVGGELIAELEKKLRLYKLATSSKWYR